MKPAPWAGKYVGIPFVDKGRDKNGCDCYGLLRLIYLNEFDLDLPLYLDRYDSTTDRDQIKRAVKADLFENWVQIQTPRAGDGVLLRIMGQPIHVGVMFSQFAFLHTEKGINCCTQRVDGPRWQKRVLGTYRHKALM